MFAAKGKTKLDTETIRGLNLAAVKLTTVQVTKLNEIGMICIAKPGLTEDFFIL
jgi:hypothetical protein